MSYFTQTAIKHISSTRLKLLRRRLGKLYGVERADRLLDRMYQMIGRYGVGVGLSPSGQSNGLSQQDVVLITYADMVQSKGRAPLDVLREFCSQHLKGRYLPFIYCLFIPGLQMMDFQWWITVRFILIMENGLTLRISQGVPVNVRFGAKHCSSKSPWFKEFVSGVEPGMNYIMEGDPEADLSAVVRPVPPLCYSLSDPWWRKNVWTTFSADQVDWTGPAPIFFSSFSILYCFTCPWVAGFYGSMQ